MAAAASLTEQPSDVLSPAPGLRRRLTLGALGALSLVVALVPPVANEASRYIFVGAIQFALLAFVAPPLLVVAAPWPRSWRLGWLARLAERRRRDPSAVRSVAIFLATEAVVLFWRLPVAVDALVRHRALVVVELLALVVAEVIFWLELVESAPLSPRLPRQRRMIVATFAMWAIWSVAYLVGLSHEASYPVYASVGARGLSVAADQQVMAGVLWAIPALVFLPVIFANLMAWLRDEQEPDEEMQALTRVERRRMRWEMDNKSPRG